MGWLLRVEKSTIRDHYEIIVVNGSNYLKIIEILVDYDEKLQIVYSIHCKVE